MSDLLSAIAGDREIETLLSDNAQLDAMLRVEVALANASAEAGLIGHDAAAAINTALGAFQPDLPDLAAGMARDGVVVPALLVQLRRALPDEHRTALHKGATSQDIIDTAMMLQTALVLDLLQARLSRLVDLLVSLRRSHAAHPLMAHTRMQAALPTHWGSKIDSWVEPLQRHLRAMEDMRRSLLVIQLGGPVGDRASFEGKGDAIAESLARHLDLGIAAPWHTQRDPVVALGSRLALLTGTLGKIGADVALLAQTELAAVTVDGGGSSAMPHKSNPVAAEVLVALARYNAGLAGTLQQAMVHENERSGAAWTLEWLTLPPIFISTGAALTQALRLLEQTRIA